MTKIENFNFLRVAMETYTSISDDTWESLVQISTIKMIKKDDCLCYFGDTAKELLFVVQGLLRAYILDEQGHEYNKNFFLENSFAGSMVSLLTKEPSYFEIEALEDSKVIFIDYEKFRELLVKKDDLKLFQIYYLEKNWLIEKESREVAFVQKSATERYVEFLEKYPTLESGVFRILCQLDKIIDRGEEHEIRNRCRSIC